MLELTERLGTDIESTEIYDSLTLPYELRIRGRLRATTDNKRDVGLFLDRGPVLREGDCLQAKTGEIIVIRADDEAVVTATVESGAPLARLCYHLGNRHVTLQIGSGGAPGSDNEAWVRFPPDHVLEELAQRLGAQLTHHRAPFDPEPGAYSKAGEGHSHSHGDGHSHGHVHSHGHGHSHSHDHNHEPGTDYQPEVEPGPEGVLKPGESHGHL